MMRDVHNRLLQKQFEQVLRDLGQELMPEDAAIARAFLEADQHVTEADILRQMDGSGIDLSHIRRTLRILCELGIAQRTSLGGVSYYEHLHLDNHHDHLVCVCCGKIIEFVDEHVEAGQRRTCDAYGFTPLMHKLEIRGVCRECAGSMPETRSLASCLEGERVEIAEVLGGRGIKQRLLALGLTRGTRVTVMSVGGPVTLEVRGARIALGHNEAAKIIVRHPRDTAGRDGGPDGTLSS